ncbi:MAG TPA: energy transducer TonB [Polyangiaceae bacterium]|nr:energy transducer TonB [Polyangiaceae bacterium]
MNGRSLVLLRPAPDTLRELIGELGPNRRGFRVAVVLAACTHAAVISLITSAHSGARPPRPFAPTELVVELPPPTVPSPPPAPVEPPAQPTEPPPRAPRAPVEHAPASPAPPEVARAGAVLTNSDPTEPLLDLTDTVVTGIGANDPGGVTSAQGTSARFSRAVATADPVRNSAPARASAGNGDGPDRSRGPNVIGGLSWDCPFPAQADVDGVNRAQVSLRVEVDPRGRPTRVRPLTDPGHGFAEAARTCALRKQWLPGTDRSGRPSTTGITLNVRFVR